MEVPEHWRDYLCEDYFDSPFASTGYWDEPGAIWYIEPFERVEEDTEAQFLQVGRPESIVLVSVIAKERQVSGLFTASKVAVSNTSLQPCSNSLTDG